MLAHLQWHIHEITVNSSPHLERVQLFLLEFGQHTHLVHLGLLLGKLRLNRLLVYVEPFAFNIVASCQFVGLTFGIFVSHARDHAEVVQGFVGVGLQPGLRVVGVHGRGARLLVHQIALQGHAQTLIFGFGRL